MADEQYDIDEILGLADDAEEEPAPVPQVSDILGVEAEKHVQGVRPPSLRQRLWLAYYTDPTNPVTFSNAAASARAAGYAKDATDAGKANLTKFRKAFNAYFESQEIGRRRVFEKLHELLQATETKFFAHEGEVTDEREVKAHVIQLGAAKALAELLGMKVERKIVENGVTLTISKDDAACL